MRLAEALEPVRAACFCWATAIGDLISRCSRVGNVIGQPRSRSRGVLKPTICLNMNTGF